MKLKQNSWHSKFYKFNYDKEATTEKNFCNYFWKTILAIIVLPITLFGWLVDSITFKDKVEYTPKGLFVIIVSISLFGLSYVIVEPVKEQLSIWFYPTIIGVIISIILIIILFYFLIKYLEERKINDKPKQPNFFIQGFKDWKNKTCSIIEWEEKK